MIPRFHLAFPVNDLKLAKQFYTEVLQCELGIESSSKAFNEFFDQRYIITSFQQFFFG